VRQTLAPHQETEGRTREEEYRGLFQNMLEGLAYCRMLYDAQGLPVDWIYLDTNPAFERIAGLANIRGRKATEVIPGIRESNPELFEVCGRVAQNGQPARFETRIESLGIWFDLSVFCPSREHFVAVFQDITQRKQVEAALREGRNTLAQIMNSLPQAVFWKDRDGVYLGCNRVFARSAGVPSVDAIVGKTDFDLPWPRHEAEAYRADDRDVVEHNNPKLHIVEPIQQADGTRLWIDTSKVPLTDETGQVRGVLGVYEDITERKRAEEALRESEVRYRTLFTSAGEGIVATDLETMQFRYANPCICRMFGYTEEEFMRLGIADIHPRGSWDSILTEIEARVRGEKTGSDTIPCLHKNGTVFYAELSPAVLDGSKCIWAFFTDVTERKRAEEALRESEERFSRAIHATEEGLWEWDILTGQEFFSPRWCEIIGYSFDDAELPHTYDSWAGRIHPDDSERVSSALKNHLEKGTRYDVDYRHRHKSGEYHWQNSKGKASADESGKPVRMTGCISDITERKRVEERLRYFQKAVDDASDAIGMATPEGRHYYQNRAFTRLFGLSAEDVDGEAGPASTVYADEAVGREVFAALMRGDSWIGEVAMLDKDRNTLDILLQAYSIKDERGNSLGLVGVHTDITAHKRAEKEVARLAAAVEQSAEAIVITGTDGRAVYVNRAFERTSGFTREEIIGLIHDQVTGCVSDPALHRQMLETVAQGHQWSGRVSTRRKDGTFIQLDMTITPVRDETGTIVNHVSILRDATQQLVLPRQHRQAQKV